MKHNWEYKKIKEVCKKESSNLQQNKIAGLSGDYPVYGAGGIVKNVTFYEQEKPYVGIVKDGAGVGRANIYPAKTSLLGTLQYILPNPDIIIGYLLYCLQGLNLSKFASGATIPHIYFRDYGECLIPLPPLSVQERIVEELDRLSLILEKKKQQIKELDSLAQSIFYDMFGDPIENEKDWEVKKLGEVGEIVTGSTPSTTDNTNWNGKINWVTPAELSNQLFYGATQRRLTEKGAKNLTLMPVGTVLLSSRAPIGKIAITTQPMCCNQGFKNIICGEYLNNIFLYYYLLITLENIKALGCGATFKEVSKKAIYSYETILPPLDLQQSFAKKIEAIEKQKELINQSIKEVQLLFDAKMDYYFGD